MHEGKLNENENPCIPWKNAYHPPSFISHKQAGLPDKKTIQTYGMSWVREDGYYKMR